MKLHVAIGLEKGLFPRSHPNFLVMLLKSKLSYLKCDFRSFITSNEDIKFKNVFSFYLNSNIQRFLFSRRLLAKNFTL